MDQTLTFCASPGRGGTGYLAAVLRSPSATIAHEPDPRFSDVSYDAQFDQSVARAFWTECKLPAIDGQRWVETSHVFINGFAEVPEVKKLLQKRKGVSKP